MTQNNQITLKDIVELYNSLKEKYGEDIANNMKVYIGDDEELNGAHRAWYAESIDPNNKKDKDLFSTDGLEDIKEVSILIS